MDQKQQALQEVETVLNDNPYYAKYADKIKKLEVSTISEKLKASSDLMKFPEDPYSIYYSNSR